MKVGDLISIHLPHVICDDVAIILKEAMSLRADEDDPTDRWWRVLWNGEIKDIHQDYVKEVICEGR